MEKSNISIIAETLDEFLQKVGEEELLSAEEEKDIIKRIQSGEKDALERLIRANARFVVSVANQYQNRGSTMVELINAGIKGIAHAAENYNLACDEKFITYAVGIMRQSILESVQSKKQ